MANGLDILNAAKKQKKEAQSGVARTSKFSNKENRAASNVMASGSIEELEKMYFGGDNQLTEGVDYTLMPNGEQRPIYDPREEMKEIQNGTQFNVKESKMPSAILESIMNNPLNMPAPDDLVNSEVLDEAVQNKAMDIINKLEAREGKPGVKKAQPASNQQMQQLNEIAGYKQNVEYNNNDLASLLESIIDKKFKQYGQTIINESRKATGNSPSLKFMRLGESFTFMDDANNVYECKMVYKGKGKMKQK